MDKKMSNEEMVKEAVEEAKKAAEAEAKEQEAKGQEPEETEATEEEAVDKETNSEDAEAPKKKKLFEKKNKKDKKDEQIADLTDIEQDKVIHACEMETSMILRLRPRLVKMEAARGARIPFESAFYCPDFSRPSRVTVPRGFEQLSKTGAFARPETATAEKGELLLGVAVREIISFVREFAAWSPFDPQ